MHGDFDSFLENYPHPGANIGVYHKGFWHSYSRGILDDRDILTSPQTYYDLASLTKTFTATTILTLQHKGKLNINDAVQDYLPFLSGFNNIHDKPLQIRDLMTHQSGLQLRGKSGTVYDKHNHYTKDQIENIFYDKNNLVQIDPPTNISTKYACINYIFLGRILEVITKLNLDQVICQMLKDTMIEEIMFNPLIHSVSIDQIAKTELININGEATQIGIVQDEKARDFGGVCGNAGLFGTLNGLRLWAEAWLKNTFEFDETIYYSAFCFNNSSMELSPKFGTVWRNGTINISPNMSGFSGCTIMLDPRDQTAIVITQNSTFLTRPHQNERLKWSKELTEKVKTQVFMRI